MTDYALFHHGKQTSKSYKDRNQLFVVAYKTGWTVISNEFGSWFKPEVLAPGYEVKEVVDD